MTDYFSPTVIDPCLPIKDITPLEMFFLKEFLSYEVIDDTSIYFHSSIGPYRIDNYKVSSIKESLGNYQSNDKGLMGDIWNFITSDDPTFVEELGVSFDEEMLIEILENIIDRSSTVDRIDVITSFTCSKMRSDGFGGRRVSITTKYIDIIDTNDIEDEPENETELDNKLKDAIVDLIELTREIHRGMNDFLNKVRKNTGLPWYSPEIDVLNDKFRKAGLDKAIE